MGLLPLNAPTELRETHAMLELGVLEAWQDENGEVVLLTNAKAAEACLRQLKASKSRLRATRRRGKPSSKADQKVSPAKQAEGEPGDAT